MLLLGTNWNATDSDGQTINNDATQLSWHYRRIDLSAFAGKIISQIYLVPGLYASV